MTLIGQGDKPRDRCHSADYHTNLSTGNAVKWCLPDSPKPDSPKLGFRVRVRVSVSANRDWTGKMHTSSAENASNDMRIRFGLWMQFTVFSKCLYTVQLIWSFKNGLMRMRGSIYMPMSRNTAPAPNTGPGYCLVRCILLILIKTRSQAVARIADRTDKNCRCHVTTPAHFQGHLLVRPLGIAHTKPCIKFEVSSSSSFEISSIACQKL